jgi:hypothetical protein
LLPRALLCCIPSIARRLAAAIEPFAAQVYFAPECHASYEKIGFGPSPHTTSAGVQLPDGPAYFCSRGSVLGQVPGEVVAATFAVFNPAAVIPSVALGWTLTDAATLCETRTQGAMAQLVRILGETPAGVERANSLLERATADLRPEGRPLYAGLRALTLPDGPLGESWRRADMLREYRGDAHTAAWTSAGFDAVEIGLVTERYWGVPPRSYVRTRAWSDADLDGAADRLRERGILEGADLSPAGRRAREEIEKATDAQCGAIVAALGDDVEELIALTAEWSGAIQAAAGYPPAGPHDLARLAGG